MQAAAASRAGPVDHPAGPEPRSAEELAYLASTSSRETPSKSLTETPRSDRKPPPETIGMTTPQRLGHLDLASAGTAQPSSDPAEGPIPAPSEMSNDEAPRPHGTPPRCQECGSAGALYQCGSCHGQFHSDCLRTVAPLQCNRCSTTLADETADDPGREARDSPMEGVEAPDSPPTRGTPKRAFQTPTRSSARIRRKTRAQERGCEGG